MIVAIIPARGGSKRIPRKNIRDFCGKPMIAWSIETAKESHLFDRIIVSTDDDEIAEVAQRYGAEVPFRRPTELADDYTPTVPVVAHALAELGGADSVSAACCIYATAPFVSAADLVCGLERLRAGDVDYTFAATTFGHPIQRAFRVCDDGIIEMFEPNFYSARSQDLEEAFHDAGQFYWGTAQAWISEKPLFLSRSSAVFLPKSNLIDIDTLDDWNQAELLMKIR